MRSAPFLASMLGALGALGGCGNVGSDGHAPAACGAALRDASLVVPAAERDRPELGAWHVDPALGGCLARVTDHTQIASAGAQTWPGRQAWNADGSLIVLRSGEIVDAERFGVAALLPLTPAVWSATEANVAHAIDGNALVSFDVSDSGASVEIARFDEYERLDADSGLGDPSRDGRWIALVGVRAIDGVREIFSFDLEARTKSVALAAPVDAVARPLAPRWAAMSPSGSHVVVAWPEPGAQPFHGVIVYDRDMKALGRASAGTGAADLAVDANGVEWLVQYDSSESVPSVDKSPLPDGWDRGESVRLLELEHFHNVRVACRAPGADTCAISVDGDPNEGWQAFENEVFVIDLASSVEVPLVERLVHHQSEPGFVAAQPHVSCDLEPDVVFPNAALSRDGRQILFTSNWKRHCIGELYLARR